MSAKRRSAIEARLFEYCPWVGEEFDPFALPEHPSPASVADKLRMEFDEEEIIAGLEQILLEEAAKYEEGQVPDSRELRLSQCAMELVAATDGFKVSPATARRLLSSEPKVIAAPWLKPIIDKVLSRGEVVEELLRTLRAARTSRDPRVLRSALAGVRVYWGRGTGPLSPADARQALAELWAELEALKETDDFEVARVVKSMREGISNSGIPRPR